MDIATALMVSRDAKTMLIHFSVDIGDLILFTSSSKIEKLQLIANGKPAGNLNRNIGGIK